MAKFKLEKQYRLPEHDYASEGFYFVTICTKDREEFFGEIRNGIMGLNEIGCVAAQFWLEIPSHFKNVQLGAWVVMPNHLHGIIEILDLCKPVRNQSRRDVINHVPTGNGFCVYTDTNKIGIINNPMQIGSTTLGKMIRWFKGKSTYEIRKHIDPNFAWQSRFHDRVIRNENELDRIHEYILNNPRQWETDRNHVEKRWLWNSADEV